MSSIVTLNGVQYIVPAYNDTGWAQGTGNLSQYLAAIASSTLQPTGGSFTLTADVDFGANFGLKALFLKTETANPASAGVVRLARADLIEWRNNANSANLTLGVDATDRLVYSGTIVRTLTQGHILVGNSSNEAADVAMSGDVTIVDGGATTIANSAVTNAKVSSSAAIAYSKLAALTVSRALVSDGSGVVSVSAVTAATLAFLDATSSVQTQLDAKAATNLSNVASVSANVPMNSKKFTGLAAGSAAGDSVRYEQVIYIQAPVSATDTTTTTTTSLTYVTTGLTASITPRNSSSRIKISVTGEFAVTNGSGFLTIKRGSTNIGDFVQITNSNAALMQVPVAIGYIDSPATGSSVTYTVNIQSAAGVSVQWNRGGNKTIIILEEVV